MALFCPGPGGKVFEPYPVSRRDDDSRFEWCNNCGCHRSDHGPRRNPNALPPTPKRTVL